MNHNEESVNGLSDLGPREIGAQLGAADHGPFLGGDRLDERGDLGRNGLGAVKPGPDVALPDELASRIGEFASKSGLPADNLDRLLQRFSGHDAGLYYQGGSYFNTQSCWTAYYLLSSLSGMAVGKYIKIAREGFRWSQAELAKRAGVSQQLIAKLESGKVNETRKLPKIAAAFGTTSEALLESTAKYDKLWDALVAEATVTRTLSPDELKLLDAYRLSSPAAKAAIYSVASLAAIAARHEAGEKLSSLDLTILASGGPNADGKITIDDIKTTLAKQREAIRAANNKKNPRHAKPLKTSGK